MCTEVYINFFQNLLIHKGSPFPREHPIAIACWLNFGLEFTLKTNLMFEISYLAVLYLL
jgi:hypothetical protein